MTDPMNCTETAAAAGVEKLSCCPSCHDDEEMGYYGLTELEVGEVGKPGEPAFKREALVCCRIWNDIGGPRHLPGEAP